MEFDDYVADRQRALFRFAVVLTGDPVLADDIVAEVMVRAYERWPKIREAGNVHAYVRKMVLNEYLGWRRSSARTRPQADLDDLLRPVADHATAHAERHRIVDELKTLPPKQRAALVLRYYEGLSFAEIAATLGTGEVTVRSNVSRALARLRITLADGEIDAAPPIRLESCR